VLAPRNDVSNDARVSSGDSYVACHAAENEAPRSPRNGENMKKRERCPRAREGESSIELAGSPSRVMSTDNAAVFIRWQSSLNAFQRAHANIRDVELRCNLLALRRNGQSARLLTLSVSVARLSRNDKSDVPRPASLSFPPFVEGQRRAIPS
jgi:hypothetical protein